MPARLFRRREQRANDPERGGRVLGAEAAGDLVARFHPAAIRFGRIVGERRGGIGQEAEHVPRADAEARRRVVPDAAWFAPAPFVLVDGADHGGPRVMEGKPSARIAS